MPPARIVVIGGGVVGTHAARMAAGPGAKVTILVRSTARLRGLDELFDGCVRTRFSTIDAVEEEVFSAPRKATRSERPSFLRHQWCE